MKYIEIILASSVIAAFVSSITSFLLSKKLKRLDFKNEYYKIILNKRINAYQSIENMNSTLISVVMDENDGKAYHLIFSDVKLILNFKIELSNAMLQGIWINDEMIKELEKINQLLYTILNKTRNKEPDEIVKIGKEYYKQISDIRSELGIFLKNEFCKLHDVKKIFKIKNKENKSRTIYK